MVLVGIISWGIECGKKNVPGVYASVQHALPFIAWDNNCHYGAKHSKYVDFPSFSKYFKIFISMFETHQEILVTRVSQTEIKMIVQFIKFDFNLSISDVFLKNPFLSRVIFNFL